MVEAAAGTEMARDEIHHVLDAFDVEEKHTRAAGDLLVQFCNTALGLLEMKSVANAPGLLVDAVRKLDERVAHLASPEIDDVPGLQPLIEATKSQLAAFTAIVS